MLMQDIPKFTPWISQEAASEWTALLVELPDKLSGSETQEWIMEEVFISAVQQQAVHATSVSSVDPVLAEMFQAEQTPCEVNNHNVQLSKYHACAYTKAINCISGAYFAMDFLFSFVCCQITEDCMLDMIHMCSLASIAKQLRLTEL